MTNKFEMAEHSSTPLKNIQPLKIENSTFEIQQNHIFAIYIIYS